jgi:cell division protein ZapA
VPTVDVSINGRLYAVACDEGQQDRLRQLAGMVDQRVRALSSGGPVSGIGDTHILVLAALTLADELSETGAALASRPRPPEAEAEAAPQIDEDLLVITIDHLADRIAVIADRLDRA